MKKKGKLKLHSREEKIRRELITKNEVLAPKYREAKFAKMSISPYTFFRGSNHLYWEDFYNDWRFSLFGGKVEILHGSMVMHTFIIMGLIQITLAK